MAPNQLRNKYFVLFDNANQVLIDRVHSLLGFASHNLIISFLTHFHYVFVLEL